jgi:ureidoglycolate lyase
VSREVVARPLTREAFAPFGDVIDADGPTRYPINGGMTERIHDLARVEATGPNARVLISIFRGKPYAMPLELKLVERHPFGSQAFMPLVPRPFLVVVCEDGPEGPETPHAFLTAPGQGVNYGRNVWHAVLTPLGEAQDFLVIDRGGDGVNLEEHVFEVPWEIRLPSR